MNTETVTLIERPYQEIVDDLLTAIVGGVVNEPIFYDVKNDSYPLAQPAQAVRSITGTLSVTVDGMRRPLHYIFQPGIDFVFNEGANSIDWPQGGQQPDDETVFYVDYFIPSSRSPLTDINIGSVTRTLSEAIGREIATVYEQINQAYRAGFIDTATGQALDLVVAILDVQRKTPEYAGGLVTFFRNQAVSNGNITIPAGTLLSTADAAATFVTAEPRTLQRGQLRIDVPVRATDASKGPPGVVPSGKITVLAQPIEGIASVTNLDATALGQAAETDDELRTRAKAKLQGVGKATVEALILAVLTEGAKLIEIWDPNGPPGKTAPPGTVALLVESEPKRFPSVQEAVASTRAAGVQVTIVAHYVFFKPRLVAKITRGLTAAGQGKIKDQIIAQMQTYVDTLQAGQPVKGADLLAAIKKVKDVQEPKIVDVATWRSDVDRPGVADLVESLATAIAAAQAGDPAALRAAITATLTTTAPATPTSRRIADRSLTQGATGQRATDSEIEAGTFQVVPPAATDGAQWWVVLDADPADIFLQEG